MFNPKAVSLDTIAEPILDPRPEVDPVQALVTAETAAVLDFRAAMLRRMLRSLPDRERAVLRMRYGFDGSPLGPTAIAQRLGCSRKTVYNLERRALDRLRADDRLGALRPVG